MKVEEIKDICLKGSQAYYDYLAAKPNGGVEEVDISNIEKINHETYKVKVTRKLFDVDSVCFRYNGQISKTFTAEDIQIKVYDNNKRTVVVKVSQEVQEYISLEEHRNWKLIIDLKFLVQRVIDWYETNGNKLQLHQEKITKNKFDESVIFQEDKYLPSIEQRKAIEMLFGNYFSYVWGAPGTGKTRFVLSYSILSYIKKDNKVLVLAPTNVALEQVLSGVLEMTDKARLERKKVLRLGFPSQEFANKYGEICEIQGLEKEIKRVNDQIKILSSIIGIQDEKEIELRQNIGILEKIIELKSKHESKVKIKNEVSAVLSTHQSIERSQQLKLKVLDLEQKKLIEKKNSIFGRMFNFLSKHIDYEKEIELIIEKQIKIEDALSKLKASIRNSNNQLVSIEKEQKELNDEILQKKEFLKEIGAIEGSEPSNLNRVLKELKKDLSKEIEDQQVYKSLSREYELLSKDELILLLNQFREERKNLEAYSLETRIENALVIGSTIDTFLHRFKDKKTDFSHIFIDEAGYASIVKALTVFTTKTPVTFLGDHKQLPPVCELSKLDIKKNGDYREVFAWDQSAIFVGDFWNSSSLKEALNIYLTSSSPSRDHLPKSSLTESFRFGPNLAKVLDRYVYDEGFNSRIANNTEIVICNVSNPQEARGRGRLNMAEALAIQNLVINNFKITDSVTILTPYRDQVKALKKLLPDFKDENKILTVHKSQGREWDTVIYSVCDIGNGRTPWFTDSISSLSNGLNNVNTAVSRAKKRLIICCCQQEWSNRNDQLIKGLLDAATRRINYDSKQLDFTQLSDNRQRFGNYKRPSKYKNTRAKNENFVPPNQVDEWESKTLLWSKSKKQGYKYSAKKNAWWKKKES